MAHARRGRVFGATRRVRLGDVDRHGRLRLDAVARYLQDVSDDDTRDSGYEDPMSWVVRRLVIEIDPWPRLGEDLALETFCGGLGPRWAERRVSISGAEGGCVEAATLWVHLDDTTMAPKRLPPAFLALFAEAAGGRIVRARLHHRAPPPDAGRRPWNVRATDLDVLDHVNNAAGWEFVEEVLSARPDLQVAAVGAEIEFPHPLGPCDPVELVVADREGGFAAWLVGPGEGTVYTSGIVTAR